MALTRVQDGLIGTGTLTLPSGTDTLVGLAATQTLTNKTLTSPTISGVSTFAAGTAALPAITTTGDTNTGIFFPAADQVATTVGGTEGMRLTSTGLGIGTSSPAVRLQAEGSSSTSLTTLHLVNSSTAAVTTKQSSLSFRLTDISGTRKNGFQLTAYADSSGGNIENGGLIFSGRKSDVDTEFARIDSAGNVGIGTSSPSGRLDVVGGRSFFSPASETFAVGVRFNSTGGAFYFGASSASATPDGVFSQAGGFERMRITDAGNLLVGGTTNSPAGNNVVGAELQALGSLQVSRDGGSALQVNRKGDDGELVAFRQAGTQEGSISVSGTTVSYNGGNLSRWAQTTTAKDESIVKGTVLSNLDEMNVYVAPTTYWTEEDELPEGVSVGDVKAETHSVENEQLNKVKVSDVEGDANVAGVFVNWDHDEAHDVDEINMAMTGDMIIRIAQGTTVARGDLLMSAGDGTAKPQGDDIVRSKTVAKVTSTHVTCTYADGSYCVPCVLMAC